MAVILRLEHDGVDAHALVKADVEQQLLVRVALQVQPVLREDSKLMFLNLQDEYGSIDKSCPESGPLYHSGGIICCAGAGGVGWAWVGGSRARGFCGNGPEGKWLGFRFAVCLAE